MPDKLVIALVVVTVIAAHLWLYHWVKFKMDEGVILQFLRDGSDSPSCSSEAIAAHTGVAVDRVAAVCGRSKGIESIAQGQDAWRLVPPSGA